MITGLDFVSLPVTDLARARAYYEGVLGLSGAAMSDEYHEYDLGDGPALGLDAAPFGGTAPVTTGTLAIAVPDLEPGFESPVCHGAFTQDSEGNRLLWHRRKDEPTRSRVIDFVQLPVADMARARAFYEGELGLVAQTVHGTGWTEYVLPDGSALALGDPAALGAPFAPVTGGTVGLGVADVDAAFAALRAYALAEAPMASPVCRLGFIRDPEGNHLVLHRRRA